MQKNKPSYIVIDSNVLISAGAKIIISGDEDLKILKKYADIEILSPTDFFERYQ
jgi:predicted nucleic acid-binding protein